MTAAKILRCHVWLIDSEPSIWRRFQISDQATLATLHTVLQRVMGWQDSHLYRFDVKGDRYTDPRSTAREGTFDSTTQPLADFQLQPGTHFIYTYDFGDGWLHRVTVEELLPMTAESPLLTCLEGERACPPEGSGGVWGYEELLERLGDPDDPEYEELLDWIGLDFDPEAFDVDAVNRQLSELK